MLHAWNTICETCSVTMYIFFNCYVFRPYISYIIVAFFLWKGNEAGTHCAFNSPRVSQVQLLYLSIDRHSFTAEWTVLIYCWVNCTHLLLSERWHHLHPRSPRGRFWWLIALTIRPSHPIVLQAQRLLTLDFTLLAVAAKVVLSNWSRPIIRSRCCQPAGANHPTVYRCCYCDSKLLYIQPMAIQSLLQFGPFSGRLTQWLCRPY